MTRLTNDFILLTTYAKYECEAEYELYKYNDEAPTAVLAIREDFLNYFVENETEYHSLDEFFSNYTYDDVVDLQDKAERANALAFAFRYDMDPQYQFPEQIDREMAEALVDFMERESTFERLKRKLPDTPGQAYMSFHECIMTPNYDTAVALATMLNILGDSVKAVPLSDEKNTRGMVQWDFSKEDEIPLPDVLTNLSTLLRSIDLRGYTIKYLTGDGEAVTDLDITCCQYATLQEGWQAFTHYASQATCVALYGSTKSWQEFPLYIGGTGPHLSRSGDYVGDTLFGQYDPSNKLYKMDAALAAWLLLLSYKYNAATISDEFDTPHSEYITVLSTGRLEVIGKLSVSLYAANAEDEETGDTHEPEFSLRVLNETGDRVHEPIDLPTPSVEAISTAIQGIMDNKMADAGLNSSELPESSPAGPSKAQQLACDNVSIKYTLIKGDASVESTLELPLPRETINDVLDHQARSKYVVGEDGHGGPILNILNAIARLNGYEYGTFCEADSLPF